MNRSYFVLVFLLVFGLSGFSQISFENVDQRVIDVYGATRVQQMVTEQPELISYLNYYVQNAYQLVYDLPAYKLAQFEDVSTLTNKRTGESITANDIDHLNVLLISISRSNEQYLTYKVGETGTVVVFIAPKFLVDQYNDWKKAGGTL